MKNRYLYVEARGWFLDDRARLLTDDPISFDSVQVEAENDAEAETLGAAAMDTKHAGEIPASVVSHLSGEFLNFYVVKVA